MLIQVGQLTCSISVPELPPSTLVSDKLKMAEMHFAIVSRIVTGDAPVSYWSIFSPPFSFSFLKRRIIT